MFLYSLYSRLSKLEKEVSKLAIDLSALTDAVNKEQTVDQSAVTLIQGLSKSLLQLQQDLNNSADIAAAQAQIKSLVDQLNSSQTLLANAITANTPDQTKPAGGASTSTTNPSSNQNAVNS